MQAKCVAALALMFAACSGAVSEPEFQPLGVASPDDADGSNDQGGKGGSGSGARGGRDSTAGSGAGQPASGAGGSQGGSAGRAMAGSGASGAGAAGSAGSVPFKPGPSGLGDGSCGLASPAFCDAFNQPFNSGGRMGELDPALWSGGRVQPNLPSGAGRAMSIGAATLPACRSGLPAKVYPDQDTLICDPTPGIANNHLLIAVAAQNYGQNSFRIRQPFDFADRTGTIVFDVDPGLVEGIGPPGWVSIEVTEDPISVPSYALFLNDEGGAKPKNAFELQLRGMRGGNVNAISVERLHVFKDYIDTVTVATEDEFVALKPGHLNRFELRVSQQQIELAGTDYSEDGVTFGPLKKLMSQPLNANFTRGYVHISMHNHATEKYANTDAAISRWDNVGFDGPVISSWREYDAPDSRVLEGNEMDIGYTFGSDENPVALTFPGVDTAGATKAHIALTAWYLVQGDDGANGYTVRYRLNGKGWHDHVLTAAEQVAVSDACLGAIEHVLEVPLAELVSGDNQVELTTAVAPTNYSPVVANVTLVLGGE